MMVTTIGLYTCRFWSALRAVHALQFCEQFGRGVHTTRWRRFSCAEDCKAGLVTQRGNSKEPAEILRQVTLQWEVSHQLIDWSNVGQKQRDWY